MTTYLMTKSGVSVQVQMQRVITKWSVDLGYHTRCHTRYELGTHTHQHKKHHHTQTAPRRTRTRYSKTHSPEICLPPLFSSHRGKHCPLEPLRPLRIDKPVEALVEGVLLVPHAIHEQPARAAAA